MGVSGFTMFESNVAVKESIGGLWGHMVVQMHEYHSINFLVNIVGRHRQANPGTHASQTRFPSMLVMYLPEWHAV